MEAIDILEKRIDSLNRIIGSTYDEASDDKTSEVEKSALPALSTGSENIVDSLISANTLLNGAITGREAVSNATKRLDELEQYLDPNYLDEHQQVRAKKVYLNAIAPNLHEQFDQLAQIKHLEPALGAEYFRNIPGECTDMLKQLAQENTDFSQQSELIEESLIIAMKRYGEIQSGIMDSLAAMNKRLDAVEEKMLEKKRAKLEKDSVNEENKNTIF